MSDFIISTESTADLPKSYVNANAIEVIHTPYVIDGVQYGTDDAHEVSPRDLSIKMQCNARVSTSMINEASANEYFSRLLSSGKDVLHISFAGVCSGTFACISAVARRLNATHPNQITVVDSKGESCGQGMAVLFAVDKRGEGASIQNTALYVESMIPKVNSLFTVNDLKYLANGGRIKKSTAYIANSLHVKPILYVDYDGYMRPLKKVFMRKTALATLVNNCLSKYTGEYKRILISHCDALADAEYVAMRLSNKCDAEITVTPISPVVGCHCGPGTVSLFVVGKDRTPIYD